MGQEKFNGEARFTAALEKFINTRDVERRATARNGETRSVKRVPKEGIVNEAAEGKVFETRSICCSFPDPVGGLCCDDHCSKIGKPGGQCTEQKGTK
ncbi:Defensin domain protein [Metarhizium guizhouense ARSEF 977]|uniref:Defensin domain protein n=1 Tax=Metarhizium guizhouense (strain ARSEF 977) TaxID=1276136 RepID=A0A0B4GAP6_METGA|nr:Defensin domain protein [Metarhizium guizhouense ARSEF 977]